MEAVFFAGAFQALFFALIILNKKNKQTADNILGIWLTMLAVTLFGSFLFYREVSFSNSVSLILIIGSMASQPVWFYLYTCSITEKSKSFQIRELLHFIPVIIVIVLFIPFYKLDAQQIDGIYNRTVTIPKLTLFGGIPLFGIIYIYIILSLIRIRIHKKKLKYIYSYEEEIDLNWLLKLTYSFLIIVVFTLITSGSYFLTDTKNFRIFDYLIGVCYVGFVFALGYFGHKQGKIFSHSNLVPEVPSKMSISIKSTSGRNMEVEEYATMATQLSNYAKANKPWLKEKITLYDLAHELDLTSHQLSSLLNDYLETSFYDYINHHRVEEVKRRLKNNNNQFTFLAIALECGFNSKASFNRIFKQKTGLTPSEYIKANKN